VDFLPHGDNLALADFGIYFFLHFLFKLDFALPKENLTLGFDNFCKDVSLFFF